MAPLNPHDVLSEALTFVQHEVRSTGVVVRLEHAIVLPIVLADKVQLQQVILNLVMNGIEATPHVPRGATIQFTLPLQRAEASDRTSPQPPTSARWRL